MSRYEFESGQITIPTAEWKKFRERIIRENNRLEEDFFSKLQELHAWVKRNRKRGEKVSYCIDRGLRIIHMGTEDYEWRAPRMLLTKAGGLQQPKRKDLRILPLSKSAVLDFDDARARLSNKTHTLYYGVSENNHACERAREHPLGIAIFRALGAVKFTRGSGGYLAGNDEYNQEDRGIGGGANNVTASYGPIGEKAQKAANRW